MSSSFIFYGKSCVFREYLSLISELVTTEICITLCKQYTKFKAIRQLFLHGGGNTVKLEYYFYRCFYGAIALNLC